MAYEYLVLPYGLSLAPCTFTKCVKSVLAPLRERGICILASFDDWALMASSREQATAHLLLVLSYSGEWLCHEFQKGSPILSQQFSFLRLEICSVSSTAVGVLSDLSQFQL